MKVVVGLLLKLRSWVPLKGGPAQAPPAVAASAIQQHASHCLHGISVMRFCQLPASVSIKLGFTPRST